VSSAVFVPVSRRDTDLDAHGSLGSQGRLCLANKNYAAEWKRERQHRGLDITRAFMAAS